MAPTITLPITVNANGTISVSGTAEPGSTVTVTFPDGSTGTAIADAQGKYGPVTSITPQTSGNITANATDAAGKVSIPVTANYTDGTTPLAPTITLPITVNANGTISVYGTAEPKSTVTITFPDGSTGTFVADTQGKYGPVTSVTPQQSGQIAAVSVDLAGNVSAKKTVPFNIGSGPMAPTIILTENPGGILVVNGKANPGSLVTITFPDGSVKFVYANAAGNYGPVKSDFPQPNGDVKAIAKDALGVSSPQSAVAYVDKTAPASPIIVVPIIVYSNGTVAVSGTAEPRSTVTVTFPDGTTGSALVDDNGNFGPIVSINPQSTGVIKAIATDINSNSSTESKVNVEIGAIALVATGILNDTNNDGFQQAGETITYSFVITNTGNVALTNSTIAFPLASIVMTGGPINLAVGASDATTFQGVYTLTQADIILGSISNQATASGTTPAGAEVTDLSDGKSILGDNPTVVTTNGCPIEVYNGMTPGGDGKNDMFVIGGIDCYPNNTVQIFNRWGVLVYNQTGYNNNDKAFRGISEGNLTLSKEEELPVGTYYYVFSYTDSASVLHEKSGYLYINK